jgi:GNAT superfamily N-acetyltransferase
VVEPAPSCRAVRPDDEAFLVELFASTRPTELGALEPVQARAFAEHQSRLARQQYRARHPDGVEQVILDPQGTPIGRLWVDHNRDPHRIVDLALLPSRRGRGLGSALVADEQRLAVLDGCDLVVSVFATDSAAMAFWGRCGFRDEGGSATHRALRWDHRAPPAPSPDRG